MKKIKLTQGEYALVDDEDFEELNKYKWHCQRYANSNYAKRWNKNKKPNTINMHRQITNCPDNMQIDHINGDGLDNRKRNLRICTQQQNGLNILKTKKESTTGIRCVSYNKKTNKYCPYIYLNGKRKRLGAFDDIEDARVAYIRASLKYYGDFSPYKNKLSNEVPSELSP